MLTVRIQEKNYSESIMVLKLKDGVVLLSCRTEQPDLFDSVRVIFNGKTILFFSFQIEGFVLY